MTWTSERAFRTTAFMTAICDAQDKLDSTNVCDMQDCRPGLVLLDRYHLVTANVTGSAIA